MAGATASRLSGKGVEVQLFSEEPVGFYSRIMLPQALCDKEALAELVAKSDPPYLMKRPVTRIDRARKLVFSGSASYPYDKLIIATGSRSRMLDIFSVTDGACTLRTFVDAQKIGETIEDPVVVLGGGLLGLETALWVRRKGFHVTVVEVADHILARQLDHEGASILKEHLEAQGLIIREGLKVEAQKLDLRGHLRPWSWRREELPAARSCSHGVLPELPPRLRASPSTGHHRHDYLSPATRHPRHRLCPMARQPRYRAGGARWPSARRRI